MKISILNAGQQTDYLYGIVSGLSEIPSLEIDVIDSDSSAGVLDAFPRAILFNLRGDNLLPQSIFTKAWSIGKYYIRLLWYTAHTQSEIFHIQWENSISLFDRTILVLYYKLFGKKLVHTAHNIYKDARDGRADYLGWISLKVMYHLMDCIIVHTQKMKEELCLLFAISPEKVVVIPHGINNRIPRRGMSQQEARGKLGMEPTARAILFFGQIDEYKGVEILIEAASFLVRENPAVVLMIAGKPKRQLKYAVKLKSQAANNLPEKNTLFRLQFIPVDEVETYFAAADCLVLPYKRIFQSGVIFLAYRFGLPIIATDIGSFREDIIDGVTGFLCKPNNANDMAEKLKIFFESTMFHQRKQARARINELAERKYSWSSIGRQTYEVYARILKHS
jgi:glycosyltransferase involved in cell wall biosynthesis